MPALLRNLSARTLTMEDLKAVSELVMACDLVDYGMPDTTMQDILSGWQQPGFNLKSDAWVIVTISGQIVAYASLSRRDDENIKLCAHVHPAYRGRGIGMLLLRLAEARAREYSSQVPLGTRVSLSSPVSHTNQAAKRLLEREGYTAVKHFWRLIVEMDEAPPESPNGGLKVDLLVDAENLMGMTQVEKRTGIYIARQYDVYEKELRSAIDLHMSNLALQQCAS